MPYRPQPAHGLFIISLIVAGAYVGYTHSRWSGNSGTIHSVPQSGSPSSGSFPAPAPSIPPSRDSEDDVAANTPGFPSRALLEEHYQKHGREFGGVSIEQYLHMAQALRDKSAGEDILEGHEPAGHGHGDNTIKFDKLTGSFIAYDSRGVIHTFFRPNDGEAYYKRKLYGSMEKPGD